MIKKFFFFFLFGITGFQTTRAQGISGDWTGVLKVMGTSLHIVFHIKADGNGWSATMDSPDQQASGIPVSKTTFQSPDLQMELPSAGIVYKGKLENEDSVAGIFEQSGMKFPLTLYRGSDQSKEQVRPPKPQPPFPYKSETVRFENKQENIQLAGTLTIPDKDSDFPAVILITGSGPQDRNETILGHQPFWVIADYLSRSGIAVLRYDDRGVGESTGDFNAATTADFATDVESAVQFLKSRKEINPKKIGLIGHSEGGIIAPMVAAKDKSIDFIVLLAAPGYNGADLLVMQNEAMGKASGMSDSALAQAAQINRSLYQIVLTGKADTEIKNRLAQKLRSVFPADMPEKQKKEQITMEIKELTSPWMRYFLKNNPADYLKKVRCPVLALDGTKDLQVPAERNIAAIKKALTTGGNQQVTTKIFSGLNHLFQDAKTGLPDEYGAIEETFSPKALSFMTDWIKKEVK